MIAIVLFSVEAFFAFLGMKAINNGNDNLLIACLFGLFCVVVAAAMILEG